MRFVKRVSAVLICILLVLLTTACGQPEPATADPQTTAEQTTAVTDTTAPASEPQTVSETVTASQPAQTTLTPTQADLDTLLDILHGEVFFGADYDSQKDNILDYLYDNGLLFELFNMETLGLLKENETLFEMYSDGEADPLGHFAGYSYIRVKAEPLNDYMENVFCNTVYKDHTTSYDDDGNVRYYLHDGWYYFSWEVSGIEGVLNEVNGFTEKDGRLNVTIKTYWVDPGDDDYKEHVITLAVDAALREENGAHAWSIYSTKVTYHKY